MFNILVPVDGSEDALLAVRHTVRLASTRGDTQVHLLNVQPPMNRHVGRFLSRRTIAEVHEAAGHQRLSEAERILRESGVGCQSSVLSGEPAPTAAQYAREHDIDQIVVGTARRSTLMRLLAGSFTNKLVQEAIVPVVVVAGSRPGAIERFGVPAGVGLGLTALLLAAD